MVTTLPLANVDGAKQTQVRERSWLYKEGVNALTLVLSGNTTEVLWIIPPRHKNCSIILHPYDFNCRAQGSCIHTPLHVHITLFGTPLTSALPQLQPPPTHYYVISLASLLVTQHTRPSFNQDQIPLQTDGPH